MRHKVLDFSDPQPVSSPSTLLETGDELSLQGTSVFEREGGRNGEWRLLQRLWQQALSGHAKSFLLLGDGGFGKTHLLRQWVAQLNQPAAGQTKNTCNALVLWLDASQWHNVEDMQQAMRQQWQQWAWAQWRGLLEALQELPSPLEQAEPNLNLGWSPERLKQAQELSQQAHSEQEAIQALVAMISELWKPTLSFWQRWGFSPQAYAEQVYQQLMEPNAQLAQQIIETLASGSSSSSGKAKPAN